jgi:hypothetical protein
VVRIGEKQPAKTARNIPLKQSTTALHNSR